MKTKNISIPVISAIALLSLWSPATNAATTEQIAKNNCQVCASTCDDAIKHCIAKKDQRATANVVDALRDCSSACKSTFDFLARGSTLSKRSATLCIRALNHCTKSCESFTSDNSLKACADECRKTASNLQKVVNAKDN